jgi:hypothetical protein
VPQLPIGISDSPNTRDIAPCRVRDPRLCGDRWGSHSPAGFCVSCRCTPGILYSGGRFNTRRTGKAEQREREREKDRAVLPRKERVMLGPWRTGKKTDQKPGSPPPGRERRRMSLHSHAAALRRGWGSYATGLESNNRLSTSPSASKSDHAQTFLTVTTRHRAAPVVPVGRVWAARHVRE